ncbi:MAG: orotidine-5'-phosphate decarboxylase [Candidatus Omnitrophota bacterium]
MPKSRTELIVALDVDSYKKAEQLINSLYPKVKFFKVGSQLFTACGPSIIKMIKKRGAKVFLDLKFHDIPNTVKNAVKSAAKLKVDILTVHLSGGLDMLKAAASVTKKIKIVGVTVLTSKKEKNILRKVLQLAKLAKQAKLDGVVCSVQEAANVRSACGKNFSIITPGIRPKGSTLGDQKRVASAKDALSAGADFIVVGRPITEANNPKKAAQQIIKEIQID